MKKNIFRALFACALVLSQQFVFAQKQFKNPIAYNDYLVSTTDTLYTEGQKWGEQFNKVYSSRDFASLADRRKKLLSFIKRKQVEVVTMKDLGGSEMLRLAMLDFLFFEERMITEVFLPMEKLSSKSTTEEIETAVKKLTEMAKEEDKFIKKVNQAQEVYAAKNGFTIDKEEED